MRERSSYSQALERLRGQLLFETSSACGVAPTVILPLQVPLTHGLNSVVVAPARLKLGSALWMRRF